MAKFTVSEFVIQVGFQETVMKNLSRLEAQVNKVATNMELRLNRAFKTNGAKVMGQTFDKITRDANRTGLAIKKALQDGFNVKTHASSSIKGFQSEASIAARAVAKEFKNAFRIPRGSMGLGGYAGRSGLGGAGAGSGAGAGGAGRGGGGGLSYTQRQDKWMESHFIRNTESGFTNVMKRMGMVNELGAFRQTMQDTLNKYKGTGDSRGYEREARQAIFQYKDIVRAQKEYNRALDQGRYMQKSLENSTLNLVKGFASVYTALEFFKGSLEEGYKRQQTATMSKTAFGEESQAIIMAIDEYANKYGADRTGARQQASQLRMTMPDDLFSNADIVKLLETESVFAHQTGMAQEAVGRLNYAMQQIATSTHLMGQDWLQVVNASPALIKQLLQLTGKTSVRELKEFAKTMSGADFVKKMVQAMEQLNNSADAYGKAQSTILVAQMRIANGVKDIQAAMFFGMVDGVMKLFNAVGFALQDNTALFKSLGNIIGYVAQKLTPMVYFLDNMGMIFSAYLADFTDFTTELRKQSPIWDAIFKAFDSIAGAAINWIAVATAIKLIGSLAGIVGRLAGLGSIGAAGSAAAAAAGGAAGTTLLATIAATAAALALPLAFSIVLEKLGNKFISPEQRESMKLPESSTDVSSVWDRMTKRIGKVWDDFNFGGGRPNNQPLPTLDYTSKKSSEAFSTSVNMRLEPVRIMPINIKVDYPDGTSYTTTSEVQQILDAHVTASMMSSQGLGGGWQIPGQNAGYFSPSYLKR